jgi:hypothetical protein
VWRHFAAAQLPDGQVPTSIASTDGAPYQVFADESSMFFVLLAVHLQRDGREVDAAPFERAATYVLSRVDDSGRFITPAGAWGWWLDTYVLLAPTTLAYCQGLLCATLLALRELGVPLPRELLDAALAAHRETFNPDVGAITLSSATTDLDVSCLVGEYLCQQMLARSVLPPHVVTRTLERFARAHHPDGELLGFKIATQPDGSYLPREVFATAPDNFPGHYHNGGSWLLYDAIALAVAHHHGHPAARELLAQRVRSETRRQVALHEYLVTEPSAPAFGTTPFDFRLGYGWNSYVARILDEVGL